MNNMKTVLAGELVLGDGVQEKTILIEDGIIVDSFDGIDTGMDSDTTHQGMIYPGLMDLHTHLGDHMARGPLPSSLKDVVLPGGIKHRFLETSDTRTKIESVRRSLDEVKPGVTHLFDYREGGLEGISILNEAYQKYHPNTIILARPGRNDDVVELLKGSQGLGLPSVDSCTEELRDITKKMGKIFSFHASEMYREDIEKILQFQPDLLVHMISGTEEDWISLAEENIPTVVCPRSNFAYSLPLTLAEMNDRDVPLALGTDNSISARQDMFRELEMGWLMLRRNGMEGSRAAREVFSMAVGEKIKNTKLWDLTDSFTGWWESTWPRKGDPAYLMVLDRKEGPDPFSNLVRFTGQDSVLFTGPENH